MISRQLQRSVLVAGILAAIFAGPVLTPHREWSELAGSCIAGDDGGCAWDDSAGACW
jgi:hypothetical protein